MSKNLSEPSNSEEFDLGELFKLIGNAFDRLFKLIGSILNTIFLSFVWLVFFFKKNIVLIGVAAILGFGIGYLKEKMSKPVYQYSVNVKQNYKTGKNLYNLIDYYNDLIKEKDKSLAAALGISQENAEAIVSIEIEPTLTENQMIINYDNYVKKLDSALAASIDYKTYFKNTNFYEFEEQEIKIKAHNNSDFNNVFNKIVEHINQTEYFKRENEKDIDELNNRSEALNKALIKSDSLQNLYKRILEKPNDDKMGTETTITFEVSDQVDKTKEFELYKSEIEIRAEMVDIERQKQDKSKILEIITSSQEKGVINKKIDVLGKTISAKLFMSILFVLLTVLVLLSIQFLKYLERFKEKV